MDGFLFIDKPIGMTSRDVCNQISRLFKTKKVGHIGTLDPFATGLLIVTINKGNKAGTFLDGFSKEYIASLLLGEESSTGDTEGEITKKEEVKAYSIEEINKTLNSFLGKSMQIPPMTSAISINGKKLYKLAHQGKEIERPAREINVLEISLEDYKNNVITFKTFVSKGTYIRVLGEDIAKKLDTVGHLISLRRTKVGPFDISEAHKLEDINESSIVSIYDVLSRFSNVYKANEKMEKDIKDGKILELIVDIENDNVLVVNQNNEAIAMYKKENDVLKFQRGLF